MKKRLKWLFFVLSLLILLIVLVMAFFFSPDPVNRYFRETLSTKVTHYFDILSSKVKNKSYSQLDYMFCSVFYRLMIVIGGFIYPEASEILHHYLFGEGEDLFLNPTYYKTHPFILSLVKNQKKVVIGPIGISISEDPRLAYAINPFYIKVSFMNGCYLYEIYQRIEFDKFEKNYYTVIKVGEFSFKLKDGLVYIFEQRGGCKPFDVYVRWTN